MNKKILSMLSVLSLLCSCSELVPEDEAGTAKKFTLYLTDPVTRTVNDGMSTKWCLKDRVQVLFAEAGTSNYQQGIDFIVTDAELGKVEGTLPAEFDPNLVYDWYLSYANVDPASPKVNMPIGIWGSERFEIQTGNNSLAHLAGSWRYPLVGNVKGIPGTNYPTVKMKNVAAVIAFNVRNATENELTLQDIRLKAPELINGEFEVDFSGEDIVITPKNKESIARLEIQEGTPLKPGETAKFYMGVKPFSYLVGEELLCVPSATAQGKTLACRVAKLLEAPLSFDRGTITTLNLDFTSSTAPLAVNKADFDTFNQGIQITGYSKELTSLDGWRMVNSAANSSFIGLDCIAPTLSGNLSAPGVLTSPLLAKGCRTLTFKYGVFASKLDQLSFKVEALNEAGKVLWTKDITEPEPIYKNGYIFSETVNVAGPFRLRFTNLCPTGATYHKDRVSLYDLSWTNVE